MLAKSCYINHHVKIVVNSLIQVYFHFLDIMKGIRHIFFIKFAWGHGRVGDLIFRIWNFHQNLNRILMTCHTMTWNWNVVCCILSNFFFIKLCDQPILVRGTITMFLILIIPIYRLFMIDKRRVNLKVQYSVVRK